MPLTKVWGIVIPSTRSRVMNDRRDQELVIRNLIVDLALVKIPHPSHLTQRTAEQIQREMAIFPIKKDILII